MAKPQTIGSHTFNTKTEAVAFIREILHRYPLLEPISGEDHEFLLELLKKHPSATKKIGAGVKCFTVEKAKGGTQCFYINRIDDSKKEDFSFGKCLRG